MNWLEGLFILRILAQSVYLGVEEFEP
jgi:hypothetical protein